MALANAGKICGEEVKLTVRGVEVPAQAILRDLQDSIENTKKAFLQGNYDLISPDYNNPGGLPDGSSLYGVLFHSKNPAVGPFNNYAVDS